MWPFIGFENAVGNQGQDSDGRNDLYWFAIKRTAWTSPRCDSNNPGTCQGPTHREHDRHDTALYYSLKVHLQPVLHLHYSFSTPEPQLHQMVLSTFLTAS